MATLEDLYRATLRQNLAGQGGASRSLGAAAQRQARAGAMGVGSGMAGLSPFLAARQAGQAAAQASIGAGVEEARLRAQEQAQALGMAQQQIAADRAREDRWLGAGLGAGAAGLGTLLSAFGGGGGAGAAPGGLSGLIANTSAGLPGFTGPADPGAQPGVQQLRATRDRRLGIGGLADTSGRAMAATAPLVAPVAPQQPAPPQVAPQPAPTFAAPPAGAGVAPTAAGMADIDALGRGDPLEEDDDPLAALFGVARGVAPMAATAAGGPLAGLGLGALLQGIG